MEDFKFSEIASMDRLFKDIIEVINEAEKGGMEQGVRHTRYGPSGHHLYEEAAR